MDLFSKHGPFDLEADNGSGIKENHFRHFFKLVRSLNWDITSPFLQKRHQNWNRLQPNLSRQEVVSWGKMRNFIGHENLNFSKFCPFSKARAWSIVSHWIDWWEVVPCCNLICHKSLFDVAPKWPSFPRDRFLNRNWKAIRALEIEPRKSHDSPVKSPFHPKHKHCFCRPIH